MKTKTTKTGFSTGCSFRTGLCLDQIINLYHAAGARAIELSFSEPQELIDYVPDRQMADKLQDFEYLSIHAPWHNIQYGKNKQTQGIIDKLKETCEKNPVLGIVVHPNVVEDYSLLEISGLPILLENMDRRTKYTTPDFFDKQFRNYKFGFVLDVQHAYEHDSSMQLAAEYISVAKDRLKEVHVSGQTKVNTHMPVTESDNIVEVMNLLKQTNNAPRILEGILWRPKNEVPDMAQMFHLAQAELKYVEDDYTL